MRKALIFCILLSLIGLEVANAQKSVPFRKGRFRAKKESFKESVKDLKEGNELYVKQMYLECLDFFENANELNSRNALLNYKMGHAYLKTQQYKKAIYHLEKALVYDRKIEKKIHNNLDIQISYENSLLFLLGEACSQDYQWDKAIEYFSRYIEELPKNKELVYALNIEEVIDFVEYRIDNCKSGKLLCANQSTLLIENLGPEVNTIYHDYCPLISTDESVMYFTSRREDGMGNDQIENPLLYMEDIYKVEGYEGMFEDVVNVGLPLNSTMHDGTVGLSVDGQRLFIYKNEGRRGGEIYYSELTGYKWSEITPLPSTINTEFNETHACFSPDGNTVYFVSDRPRASYGGKDIYRARKNRNGKWGRAWNLGRIVNSPYDEESVFMAPDGKTLYFSSKGHNTMGGYDIFKTEMVGKKSWTEPENMGHPINTPGDDIYFVLSANGYNGYFSSVRKGGMGETDLYKITFVQKQKLQDFFLFKGVVRDAVTNKGIEADIHIVNNDRQDEEVLHFKSNAETGKYLIALPKGFNYGVTIEKDNMLFETMNIDAKNFPAGQDSVTEVKRNVKMKKLRVGSRMVLRNIFFESGDVHLMEESMPEFNRLVKFLKRYPRLNIEIAGHTDNVGNPEFNLKLSHDRAENLVTLLINNGIDSHRLHYMGYGDTKPVASNDTPEGRKLNRRLEFKIVR